MRFFPRLPAALVGLAFGASPEDNAMVMHHSSAPLIFHSEAHKLLFSFRSRSTQNSEHMRCVRSNCPCPSAQRIRPGHSPRGSSSRLLLPLCVPSTFCFSCSLQVKNHPQTPSPPHRGASAALSPVRKAPLVATPPEHPRRKPGSVGERRWERATRRSARSSSGGRARPADTCMDIVQGRASCLHAGGHPQPCRVQGREARSCPVVDLLPILDRPHVERSSLLAKIKTLSSLPEPVTVSCLLQTERNTIWDRGYKIHLQGI